MPQALLFPFLVLFISCTPKTQHNFQLIEIDSVASCSNYKIVSTDQQDYNLSKKVTKALECPIIASINKNILVYKDGLDIRILNLSNRTDHKLFTMHTEMDGISNPAWSEDMRSIMFVIINQQKKHGYQSFCRLISLELNEDFTVNKKEKYDRPVNFNCGSICTAEPYEDFQYVGSKIKYKRNVNIDDRPGIFEYIDWTKLKINNSK